MLEGLPAWLPEVGPWGLVSAFVLLIFFGLLIPRRVHRDTIASYQAALDVKVEENERLWVAITAQQELNRQHAETARDTADALDVITRYIEGGHTAARQERS